MSIRKSWGRDKRGVSNHLDGFGNRISMIAYANPERPPRNTKRGAEHAPKAKIRRMAGA